jgi:CBS domain-containing protein
MKQFLISFLNVKSFMHFLAFAAAGSMAVKEVMRYGVTTVVNRVMSLMTHDRVRHMPVVRGGKLAGIVSIGDVVKY